MKRKSLIVTGVAAASLAAAAAFGVATGGTASAQTTPTQTTPAQTAPAAPVNPLKTAFLDKLASALGIQRSALDSALTSSANSTVDDALKAGTLTQAQADALKARIAAGDTTALLGHGPGKGGDQRGPGAGQQRGGAVRQVMVDAAAKALGLTTDQLMTELRGGKTIAQLAQAKGITEQSVVDAALAAAKTQLDKDVAAGTITQAQADATYAQLKAQGLNLLSGRGGQRGPGGQKAPATTATPAPQA